MKVAIVTGATSFIGVALVKKLIVEGFFVYAIVRPNSLKINLLPRNKNILLIPYYFQDYKNLSKEKEIKKPIDVFYHLTWDGTRGNFRFDEKLQKTNYMYSMDAYHSAISLHCKLFVSVGSQAEYGPNASSIDINEEFPEYPNTAYGRYKLETARSIESEGMMNRGISFKWLRLFSAYGPGDWKKSMIHSALSLLLTNKPIDLTLGLQLWNYIYIKDLVDIMYELSIIKTEDGIYNLASNDTRRLKDYVLQMKEITKSKSILNFGAISYGCSGIINLNPSNKKLVKALSLTHFTSFDTGIRETLQNDFGVILNVQKKASYNSR